MEQTGLRLMKNRQMVTLLFAIATGMVAATSANAGLKALRSTPNDLSNLPRIAGFHLTLNDLPNLPHAKYFILALTPNEKITGSALTFTNIRNWTKKCDEHIFVNHGIDDNLAVHSTLVSNLSNSLGSKLQNFNAVIDFGKLGPLNALNDYARTTAGLGQADFEFRVDSDCNDYPDDMAPVITTEPRPSRLAIPNR
jgi:hypothetical protein